MTGGPRFLLALLSLAASLCCAVPANAQAASSAASASPSTALPELSDLHATKSENPYYRFEIVSLGSYPITLFYVGLAFDFKRYCDNGFSSSYIPLVSSGSLTDSDRWVRLGSALGVSCLVGVIDAIIHDAKVKAAKRLLAAETEAGHGADAAAKGAVGPGVAAP